MAKITVICDTSVEDSSELDYSKFLLSLDNGTLFAGVEIPQTAEITNALLLIKEAQQVGVPCCLVRLEEGYGVALHKRYPFWDQDFEIRISDNFLLYAWQDALGVARSAELENAEILLVEYNGYFCNGGHDLFAIYPAETGTKEFREAADKFYSLLFFRR